MEPTARFGEASTCSLLRHKGMYVTSVPDQDEVPSALGASATAFWCLCTQKALGPDGQPVHPAACRAGSGRACCVE